MKDTNNPMESITAYPLTWPTGWRRTDKHKIARSRFGTYRNPPTTWKAIRALQHELNLLPARDVVISTNLRLRNDGYPMSSQREPDDRGAAIWFTLDKKPRVLACDKWQTVGENLYAIAKHVEALRGQERWGVGTLDQAFTGYAALPAETGLHWTSVLGLTLNASTDEVAAKYREMIVSRNLHPDLGGNSTEFIRVTRARDEAIEELSNGH